MNKRKLLKSMEGINKEIQKIRVEFSKNSALEESKKTGKLNYTNILRDMTVMRSLSNILDEAMVATKIIGQSNEEIETECEKLGVTPQDLVIKYFVEKRGER